MRLVVVRGPEVVGPFELREGPNVIGRDPTADVSLPSRRVSRRHCIATLTHGRVNVRDLDSANGIVEEGGSRVVDLDLYANARMQVGDFVLRLEDPDLEDDLDLEDDPLALADDLLLEDEDELTPVPSGPMPVLRPLPRRPVAMPTLPPLTEQPTAETAERSPPPILPFGPATGGFGGFVAAAPRAEPPPAAAAPPPPIAAPAAPAPRPLPAPPTPFLPRYTDDPPTASEVGVRARVTGLPWAIQAAAVLLTAGAVVTCAPVGGLLAQVFAGSRSAEELSLQRGEAIVEGLGIRNAEAIATGRPINLDASYILRSPGVQDAAVTDPAGTVLAPPERSRTIMGQREVLLAAKEQHKTARFEGEEGLWEIATPIRGEVSPGSGAKSVVGYAWVRYDPQVSASSVVSPWLRAAAAFAAVAASLGVLVGGAWLLVFRPLSALRDETEHALRGHADTVVTAVRWPLLEDLARSITRAIVRAKGR